MQPACALMAVWTQTSFNNLLLIVCFSPELLLVHATIDVDGLAIDVSVAGKHHSYLGDLLWKSKPAYACFHESEERRKSVSLRDMKAGRSGSVNNERRQREQHTREIYIYIVVGKDVAWALKDHRESNTSPEYLVKFGIPINVCVCERERERERCI